MKLYGYSSLCTSHTFGSKTLTLSAVGSQPPPVPAIPEKRVASCPFLEFVAFAARWLLVIA